MNTNAFTLTPGAMTLSELRDVWAAAAPLSPSSSSRSSSSLSLSLALAPQAYPVIEAAAAAVRAIVAKGDAAYGINTGFGLLAKTRIPDDKLASAVADRVASNAMKPPRISAPGCRSSSA